MKKRTKKRCGTHAAGLLLLGALLLAATLVKPALAQEAPPDGPAGKGPITLEELLEEALRANPDLQAARQRYEAALQVPRQVGALEDPKFTFSYSPKPTQTRAGPMDMGFGVMQMFPFYGVLDLKEEAARRMAESSGAAARTTEFDLVREVKLVFFDWLYARRALEINDVNRTLLGQFQRIAEQRYRAGLVPQSDPLKAAVALAKIDAQDAMFRRMEEVATGLLNTLINRDPASPFGGTPQPPPLLLRRFDSRALMDTALAARPEVAGAGQRVAAEEARESLAWRDYWPNLTVGAEYSPMEKGKNPMYAKDGQDVVKTTFGINVPLQLGRRAGAAEEAARRKAAAESELESIRNRVRFEVHDRVARFREAQDILRLYRRQIVPAAKLELEATRKAYENARVDFLNLLDSERSYEENLLQEAAAVRNHQKEETYLERAVGAELASLPGGELSEEPAEGANP